MYRIQVALNFPSSEVLSLGDHGSRKGIQVMMFVL